MSMLDRRRCKCGRSFEGRNYCVVCDRASGARSTGETESGAKFGNMMPEIAKFDKIRNAQMSSFAVALPDLDRQIDMCRAYVAGCSLNDTQRKAFDNVFHMVNQARYYMCVELKETYDILVEAGLVKRGEDPWGMQKR